VKTKRRVEIHIERREVSVFAGSGVSAELAAASADPRAGGLERIRPAACPACGSADLLPLTEAVVLAGLDVAALQREIDSGRLHLHCSPSGEWWVCGQSLLRN